MSFDLSLYKYPAVTQEATHLPKEVAKSDRSNSFAVGHRSSSGASHLGRKAQAARYDVPTPRLGRWPHTYTTARAAVPPARAAVPPARAAVPPEPPVAPVAPEGAKEKQ